MKTGNSGRSPMYPHFEMVHWEDFEKVLAKNRQRTQNQNDVQSYYRILFYEQFYHPQRELNNSLIYDAEYRTEISKRLDEQRH